MKTGLEILVYSAFSITLNANDTFNYATAMAVELNIDDFHWALPIAEKYDHDGITAIMAYVIQQDPIKPRITEKYLLAMEDLKKLNPEVQSREHL